MQQFTPYFPGFDANQQQQAQQGQQGQEAQQPQQSQQAQNGQSQPQDQQQQSQQSQQPPLGLNGANLAIYNPAAMQPLTVMAPNQMKPDQQPVGEGMDIGAHGKPKRKQVKNACVNCQKACKKCDVGRPCQRCIKYGLTDTCVNSVRKERKKGVKRGPYKKRNKTGESAASSGTSTPNMASPMTNANLYAQNPNVRPPMPIHYQPFPAGHYDPYGYAAAAAAAASNGQMMPQAYMVPTAIQQMYPANPPVLSYQAAMSMISPQHQQTPVHGGYRPVPIQPQPSADANANVNTSTTTTNSSSAPANPTESTPATSETTTAAAAASTDDDDEGSKLTILSKLCSEVLDRNDAPKQDGNNNNNNNNTEEPKADESQQTTPPHTRETSQDNDNKIVTETTTESAPENDAAETSAATSVAYGTPSTSPSESLAVASEAIKTEAPTTEQPQEQHQQ